MQCQPDFRITGSVHHEPTGVVPAMLLHRGLIGFSRVGRIEHQKDAWMVTLSANFQLVRFAVVLAYTTQLLRGQAKEELPTRAGTRAILVVSAHNHPWRAGQQGTRRLEE